MADAIETPKLRALRRALETINARRMKLGGAELEAADAEYAATRAEIKEEQARIAALTGPDLAERQLAQTAELLEANRRMADASEAAAKASSEAATAAKDAARWTLWVAVFTALAAAGSLATAILQAAG